MLVLSAYILYKGGKWCGNIKELSIDVFQPPEFCCKLFVLWFAVQQAQMLMTPHVKYCSGNSQNYGR